MDASRSNGEAGNGWEAFEALPYCSLPKHILEALPGCFKPAPAIVPAAAFNHLQTTQTMVQIILIILGLLCSSPNQLATVSNGTTVTTLDTGGETGHIPPTPPPPPPPSHP